MPHTPTKLVVVVVVVFQAGKISRLFAASFVGASMRTWLLIIVVVVVFVDRRTMPYGAFVVVKDMTFLPMPYVAYVERYDDA